jgi:hypothetical protein
MTAQHCAKPPFSEKFSEKGVKKVASSETLFLEETRGSVNWAGEDSAARRVHIT